MSERSEAKSTKLRFASHRNSSYFHAKLIFALLASLRLAMFKRNFQRFLGIDCLTITLQNFKLINQFNSMDAAGSLMHSFKYGMKNVVKTNWYHMLSLAGLKVFLCRLEYQDAAARDLAIKGTVDRFNSLREMTDLLVFSKQVKLEE